MKNQSKHPTENDSGSLKVRGFTLSDDIFELLKEIQKKTNVNSASHVVRAMIISTAKALGIETSSVENPIWGARRDLQSGDPEALEKVRGYAANARQFIKNPGRPKKGTSAPKEIFDELQKKSKA